MKELISKTPYQNTNNILDFHSGDSISWFVDFWNYKASDGYTLTLIFINSQQKYSFTASSNVQNGRFEFNLTNVQTTGIEAGLYQKFIILARSSDSFSAQLPLDTINIKPNIVDSLTLDCRSDNQKILDLINDCIKGRLATDYVSYKIGDREIVKMGPADLFKQKMIYENLVKKELAKKEREDKGRTNRNQLVMDYNAPWKMY